MEPWPPSLVGSLLGTLDFVGGRGGGRTHTKSELRQILSLVRLPVPPLGHYWHAASLAFAMRTSRRA
jgi:hypothetical protein